MAFSSISQAGYIMLAVLAGTPQGMASLVYYIIVYIAANLAVFGVINAIEQHTHGMVEREDYNGLYKTNPRLTMVMTLALFSLAGIPPFAGFFSKFFCICSSFPKWILSDSVYCIGKHHHFTLLLSADCKSYVHYPQ